MRGDRVPFGFELDFFTDRAAYQWPPVLPRYEIPCRVHGVVLVGDERIEVDGWGQRDHSWGAARDWWANTHTWMAGRLDDGTRCHAVGGFVGGEDFGVAYRARPGSSTFTEGTTVRIETDEGRERLPERTHMAFCDLDLEIEPIAFSPVQLIHPDDGREVRFPRALARFTDADGRSGGGWIEWNQLMDVSASVRTSDVDDGRDRGRRLTSRRGSARAVRRTSVSALVRRTMPDAVSLHGSRREEATRTRDPQRLGPSEDDPAAGPSGLVGQEYGCPRGMDREHIYLCIYSCYEAQRLGQRCSAGGSRARHVRRARASAHRGHRQTARTTSTSTWRSVMRPNASRSPSSR